MSNQRNDKKGKKPIIVVNLYGGTREQFVRVLNEALNKSGVNSKYELNEITNRKGDKTGYCYLTMEDREVHHMLLGKDSEGNKVTKKVRNKDWVRPPIKMYKAINSAFEEYLALCKESGGKFLWGDWTMIEDMISERYNPWIEIPGSPLIKLGTFDYTEEQIKAYEKKTGMTSCTKGEFKLWEHWC